jgi:hypothetical protein
VNVDDQHLELQIGDFVTWRARLWVLLGIDPMSVGQRRAELEECVSGERLHAPLDELSAAPGAAG